MHSSPSRNVAIQDPTPITPWFHFFNGNLQPVIMRLLVASRAGLAAGHLVHTSTMERLGRVMAHLEARLAKVPYLAGQEFTVADIMSVFSLTTIRMFQPIDLAPYLAIRAYLQGIGERPAYRRAMAKEDPELLPILE